MEIIWALRDKTRSSFASDTESPRTPRKEGMLEGLTLAGQGSGLGVVPGTSTHSSLARISHSSPHPGQSSQAV